MITPDLGEQALDGRGRFRLRAKERCIDQWAIYKLWLRFWRRGLGVVRLGPISTFSAERSGLRVSTRK